MTFGKYLQRHRRRKREGLEAIVKRARRAGKRPPGARADRAWFGELEGDRLGVDVAWVPYIAKAYKADPIALTYVHPSPVEGMVKLNPGHPTSGGFQPLPLELAKYRSTKAARYFIPTQRLGTSATTNGLDS